MMKKVIITLVLIINYNIVSQAQLLGSESVINKQVYKGDFVVNGDKNKYYPVIFKNAIANKINHLKIYRAYYESGPNELSRTHKGSLLLEFEVNYGHGSWGGIGTNWRVTNVRQTYHTTFGNASLGMYDMGFIVWLRGGGFKYHYESEYPAQLQVALNKDKIFDHPQNQYDVYAPVPIDTPNEENIAKHYPESKLTLFSSRNNKFYLDKHEATSNGRITYFQWVGHNLIMGSPKGNPMHNIIDFKPGGYSKAELYSTFNMYHALNEEKHEKRVSISTQKSYPTYFNAGNVGIGTTTPDAKLSVNGNIHTKEVKVDMSGWPDYVFTEDYELPSLQEVEKHINKKGHLADIPSAKEVEKSGVKLGEINKKLLQKIEELTLYTISQEKKLKAQENKLNELDDLKNRLVKLEKLLTAKK